VSRNPASAPGLLRLRGLRAGNLREINLDLPLGAWTAIHGPSGAGKSALLFGVLVPVAGRRFRVLEDPRALPSGDESWLTQVADEVSGLTPVVAGAGEIPRGRRLVALGSVWGLWNLLDRAWQQSGEHLCEACGAHWRPWSPAAAAADCQRLPADLPVLVFSAADGERSADLIRAGWTRVRLGEGTELARLEEAPEILPAPAWLLVDRLRWSAAQTERLREALELARRRGGAVRLRAGNEERAWDADRRCPRCAVLLAADPPGPATAAHPRRWLHDRAWQDWAAAPTRDWLTWSSAQGGLAARRLELLARTGVGHLAADRTLGSLSLGEARRVELVSWLALVRRGQTVVLDEPGMGLHGRERLALAELLQNLAAAGNTVLTADPAREFLEAAHAWVALGPGGGPGGGQVTAQGRREDLPAEALPPLGARSDSPAPAQLRFRQLRARHLQIPDLTLPLGRVVAICGPSGSGKSSLLEEELVPRLRAESGFEGALPPGGVGVLLERALRHAPISTLATLSGAWSEVRTLFAESEEGRMRGLQPADLVARPGQGACAACLGAAVDREGLSCETCAGLGLRADLLDLRWRSRSLREWLTTPLADLEKRLPSDRRLPTLVRHLVALGLGPRCLGERGRHLSLGERGRIALARALASARSGEGRLFLLDEPCLGLPRQEAQRVVDLFHELSAAGHSFWVAEHHEVFLRQADWLIELGPGAGSEGGRLLHAGTPAALAAGDTPTAQWWRARGRGGQAPPRVEPAPCVSRALPGGFGGAGRQILEEALKRELALRSPLLEDPVATDEEDPAAEAESIPVAWPTAPDPQASLGAVLGLESLLPELRRRADLRCVSCGGGGPYLDLAEACRARGDRPWVFSLPLPATLLARPELLPWLRAAGFRSFLRGGRVVKAGGKDFALQAGDALWLDSFRPLADADAPGRLRDLEHHLRALQSDRIVAQDPADLSRAAWQYQPSACRDCGQLGAGTAAHLGGWNLADLGGRPLGDLLAQCARCAPDLTAFARAADLLEGSSLPRRPFGAALSSLTEIERSLARTVGWILFAPAGATLLLDQPLAGLTTQLARRLAQALLAPKTGAAFWFTDAEEHASPVSQPPPARGLRPQAFSTEFDFERWCAPPRARADDRLRAALGLVAPLREHYLRTEGARLRGFTALDLDPARSPWRCEECRGSGAARGHPALHPACRSCGGSGFGPAVAVAEDRGLRWSALGRSSLKELEHHFAQTPALGRILAAARALGMGDLALDSPLATLPWAARSLGPLAQVMADPRTRPPDLRLGLAVAGLNRLEALDLSSTIEGFSTSAGSLDWREQHPALAAGP
jgi:excinuclease UvrABC ATPase subunit